MQKKAIYIIVISLLKSLFVFSEITIDDEAQTKKKKLEGVPHISYSGGWYAPFGLMGGFTFGKGHGYYVSAKCNHHIFKTTQYYFEGSSINDKSLLWTYDDKKAYSRWEINGGAVIKLYDNKKNIKLKLYVGGGVVKPRYLYSYRRTGGYSSKHVWVEYREISKMTYNTELGFSFFFKEDRNIQIGVSSLTNKHERMITFGFGKGL
ncbi:MAG: hypothetical protein JNL69_04095 [Bacteroidia bacterium]|nr:hypothetical protein [Bacteroidia bacterium]